MAFWSLWLGAGSFRKGLMFDQTFNFGLGAMRLFQLAKPLVLNDSEGLKAVSYDGSSIKPLEI